MTTMSVGRRGHQRAKAMVMEMAMTIEAIGMMMDMEMKIMRKEIQNPRSLITKIAAKERTTMMTNSCLELFLMEMVMMIPTIPP